MEPIDETIARAAIEHRLVAWEFSQAESQRRSTAFAIAGKLDREVEVLKAAAWLGGGVTCRKIAVFATRSLDVSPPAT